MTFFLFFSKFLFADNFFQFLINISFPEGEHMAISEDLRSIQTMLGSTVMTNLNEPLADLLRLACDNLCSLAEQVEALEELSLTSPEETADSSSVCSVFFPCSSNTCEAPLQ